MTLKETIRSIISTFRESGRVSLGINAAVTDLNYLNGNARHPEPIQRSQQGPESYQSSALSEYRSNDPDTAIAILAQVRDTLFSTKFTEPHIQVNLIDQCLRSVRELAERGVKSILDHCDSPPALWRLADILHEYKCINEEEAIYRHLYERKPNDPLSCQYSALSAYRLGKPEAAITILEAGFGSHAEAEIDYLFEHYLRICSECGQLRRAFGFIQESATNLERAHRTISNSKSIDSNVKIRLVEHCLKHGPREFVEPCLNSVKACCKDLPALWKLADVLLLRERNKEADAIYRQLARLEPEDLETYYYSALAAYRLHDPKSAVAILEAGMKAHPDAEPAYLFEQYLRICSELGWFDRVIRIIQTGDTSKEQACETLFNMKLADTNIRINLIDYCMKSGLSDLAELHIRNIKDNDDDLVSLWTLTDVLQRHGRRHESETIHRELSSRKRESAEDYYYAGLAVLRLGQFEKSLRIVEDGIKEHADSESLSALHLQLCIAAADFDRYCKHKSKSDAAESAPTISKLDFYRRMIRNGAPELFIINFRDLELQFSIADFNSLKSEFLSNCREKAPPLANAKAVVFFCKYLDVDADFASQLFEILQGNAQDRSRKPERAGHSLRLLYKLTLPMVPSNPLTPETIRQFITDCQSLLDAAARLNEPIRDMTNNWTPWQYIFCAAAPELYNKAMSAFERAAFVTWPKLNFTAPHIHRQLEQEDSGKRKIRIGFAVHDSMPMMSGLLMHLDKDIFETVFLRPGETGQSPAAKNWVARADRTVEYSDTNVYSAIDTISKEELDIIVAGPSVAAVFFPMMARLAHLQMVLLEPNWTDGLRNSDYYISWEMAEPENHDDFYKNRVSYLQHPPYWIERPVMNSILPMTDEVRFETRRRLLNHGSESHFYLCANTPPKIHAAMDEVFYKLLERDPAGIVVLLRGEYPPAKVLKARLRSTLGTYSDRVMFLPTLRQDDAHLLLQSVDCCLDSFPLCGMSSSFDGAMLGVPIVTLPSNIPFGRWTAAIYDYINVGGLTAKDEEEYIRIALRLALDKDWRNQKSLELKEKSRRYIESLESGNEFQEFIIQAWKRKLAGLPTANWLSGRWE